MSEVEKLIPTKRIAESILRISNGEVSTNLIEQLATDYLAADKEIERLREAVINAYECGHNDTVESCYCDPEERANEIIDEALKGNDDD